MFAAARRAGSKSGQEGQLCHVGNHATPFIWPRPLFVAKFDLKKVAIVLFHATTVEF